MSEREQRVNQSLRALDEAHYAGRISREEYRLRRRQLLGTLFDSHGITARNTLRGRRVSDGLNTAPPPSPAPAPAAPVAAPSIAWKPLLAFLVGLALCGALVYWLLAVP